MYEEQKEEGEERGGLAVSTPCSYWLYSLHIYRVPLVRLRFMALVQANESLHPVRSHFTMKYCIYFLSATPLKIQQKCSCKEKSALFLVDITWNIYEIGFGFFLSIIYHQWITLLSKPTYKGITIQGAIYNPYPPWGGFQRWLAYIFTSVRWKRRLFLLCLQKQSWKKL